MSGDALDPDRIDALTFDCYGTLVDWETGILAALRPLFARHDRPDMDDGALLAAYGRYEAEAEAGPYLPYRDVLRQTLRGIAADFGIALAPGEEDTLADSVGDWPAFPDTVPSLDALGRRYRLAILSNIDDDLFAVTAERHLGGLGRFAEVVTAQQVRSYKPNPAHFAEGLRRLALPPDRVLHVAESLRHDVPPAHTAGMHTVWVNRRGRQPGEAARASGAGPANARPDAEVSDLATLCRLLGVL